MELLPPEDLPSLPKLKLAVVGHVEWVTFLSVDKCPQAGEISHGKPYGEEPAGGGAVAAVKIASLTKAPVHFFTALGNDSTGKKSLERLNQLGLNISVAWRDQPTRKGISMIDPNGERAITVIGDRLEPSIKDHLPWNELESYDGVFVTASDSDTLMLCRKANLLVASPRIGASTFKGRNIKLDALIGSALDPDERIEAIRIKPTPSIRIATQGSLGGEAWPGGKFNAISLKSDVIDTYGCGDSFAAGVTTGLSARWNLRQAISLGAHCGAKCATHLGPYGD